MATERFIYEVQLKYPQFYAPKHKLYKDGVKKTDIWTLNIYSGLVMWHATSHLIFISRAVSRFKCSKITAASFSQIRAIFRFSLCVIGAKHSQ